MASLELTTYLDAPPERVWAEVRTSRLLAYVAKGFIRFKPLKGDVFPETWEPGEYRAWMFLFGWLPIGWQAIRIEIPESQGPVYRLRDNGYSPLIRRWDHWITLEAEGPGTLYTDRLDLDAGLLTWPVALFARIFYAHRQRRWRRLVARDFRYD